MEAQFQTRGVTTEATKFAYVIASLQPEVALEVRDLLVQPPSAEPYTKLKAALVKRTSVSEQQRLNKLLTSEELGDRTPSQLLRKMQQLLGTATLEGTILRQLFLQRLPVNVQLILASTSEKLDIDELAALADRIVEVAAPASIRQIDTSPRPSIPPPSHSQPASHQASGEVQQLSLQVAQLTGQVQALACSMQEDRRSRSPFRQDRGASGSRRRPSGSRSSSRQRHPGSECWYHWTFGEQARRCVSPCSARRRGSSSQGNAHAKD